MTEAGQKDEELASLVQSGRVELFGVLIERYELKIERYARKMLSNREDIKDVIQEIFIKAYININSFDKKKKFSSWLYRIAHNEVVNLFLKNKRKNFLPLFETDAFFPHQLESKENDAVKRVERLYMQKIIEQFFDKLQDKYKEPIELYYLEDFSYKEIADIMRLPISTVGVRIKRGKEMMRNIFKKQGYDYQAR